MEEPQDLQGANGSTQAPAQEEKSVAKDTVKEDHVQALDLASTSNPSKETEKTRDGRKHSGSEKDKDRDKERERKKEREQRRERHKDMHHHRDKRRRSSRDGSRRDRRD